jgi:hypothetical protein
VEGRCAEPCANGECPPSQSCVEGVCLSACELEPCLSGERCELSSGLCVSLCSMSCPEGEVCVDEELCAPEGCFAEGCPDGERCEDGELCAPDPCAEVSCGASEFCRDGSCVGSCALISCARDQRCEDGLCVDALCGELAQPCAEGERCVEGSCEPDLCFGVSCPFGQACVEGLCGADPCASIDCPPGALCELQRGSAQCVFDETVDEASSPGGAEGGAEPMGGAATQGGEEAAELIGGDRQITPPVAGNDGSISAPKPTNSGCAQRAQREVTPLWLLIGAALFGTTRRRRGLGR